MLLYEKLYNIDKSKVRTVSSYSISEKAFETAALHGNVLQPWEFSTGDKLHVLL
jgi:hypothetical protein